MNPLRSITVRLALFAAGVFAVIASITAAVGIVLLRGELIEELDRSNVARASDIAIQTEFGTEIPFVGVPTDTTGAAILDEDGFLVSATDDFDPDRLIDLYFDNEDEVGFDVAFDLPTLSGDDSMRGVVVTALAESDGLAYAVFVTTSTESIDRTISLVTGATVPAIVVLTALVGLLVFAMARRSLRPVERLRREAASFDGGDLTRRLPAPGREDELGRLAGTMNAMLERIETATEQQRRFASDASHELRSPLASVAAQLDVDLAHPGTADWSVTAAGVRAETMRMQRLVDDLLLLARTGSGTSVSARDDLALDDLALDDVALDDVIVEATSVVSGAGGDVSVELGDVARATIRGDGLAIRRIVDNLLANAVRHASSTVRVSLVASDDVPGEFVIDVDDDGTGIAPEDRDRVFERFVRLDDARSRDQGGSGLGLAICRELAAAMGGRVTIGDSPLGGARFTLTVVDTADRAGLAQPPTATR